MISSSSNKQIKYVLQLQQKSKLRHENKQFVVEGIKMYNEIPSDKVIMTFVKESFYNDNFQKMINNKVCNYEIVSDKVFDGMSQTKTPQGILAIVKQPEYNFDEIIKKDTSKLLFLEDIRDPGNIGTMIRTAEGAGFDGIVLSKESVDMFNPKVVRSTMGAIYRVPFIYEDNFVDAIKNKYIAAGYDLYAAHLEGAVSYTTIDYCKKTGIIIGNEANGISDKVVDIAQNMIKIPMEGQVESLNAAVSAALIMYEVYRQSH
ncbi:MAG: RNA methyltransferase [Lachnospiraceae bacterium]|nr:RNA methyltransferase [Lachnospiraceae bacterium]